MVFTTYIRKEQIKTIYNHQYKNITWNVYYHHLEHKLSLSNV